MVPLEGNPYTNPIIPVMGGGDSVKISGFVAFGKMSPNKRLLLFSSRLPPNCWVPLGVGLILICIYIYVYTQVYIYIYIFFLFVFVTSFPPALSMQSECLQGGGSGRDTGLGFRALTFRV